MRVFYILRIIVVLAVVLLVAVARAPAQSFGLGATSSASSILVSNALTYIINVTNPVIVPAPQALVSNGLPASVQFLSATSTQGSFTNYGNTIVFDLGLLFTNAQISLTVQPNAVGFITNIITVVGTNPVLILLPVSTSLVTQVTNVVVTQADLGVTLAGPAQPVIVNDLLTLSVTATNLGPDSAPSVQLTNSLPPGVILKSVAPTNQPYSINGSNLIFNLGTLAGGAGTNLQITVQPTNAGNYYFSASVGAAGVLDTNTANNLATNSITVITNLPGQLVAVTNSAQIVNQQNGLIEQSILLSNIGTNDVPAARITVMGLTNRLFNASGTNNDNPFVVYAATLGTNQSVNLLLQYAPRKNFPFTNSQLQAFAVPMPDLTPPAVSSSSTNLNITHIVKLPNGNVGIEFPSTLGRSYTVVYSDNVLFSNAMIAPPTIVAPANQTQWIDYGPPTTGSAPSGVNTRFYRVIQNP